MDNTFTIDAVSRIVASHVGNNPVPLAQLPTLIRDVFHALNSLGSTHPSSLSGIPSGLQTKPSEEVDTPAKPARVAATPAPAPNPAVPPDRSVFRDYIVCLEDGKKLKMLKRHLAASFSMTPDEYRRKWGLPDNYPMVAPAYAESRSSLAKRNGLGRRPSETQPTQQEEDASSNLPVVKTYPVGASGIRKRGRQSIAA